MADRAAARVFDPTAPGGQALLPAAPSPAVHPQPGTPRQAHGVQQPGARDDVGIGHQRHAQPQGLPAPAFAPVAKTAGHDAGTLRQPAWPAPASPST